MAAPNRAFGLKPKNPLDKFQTYSYHHYLLASNSTEALRIITESNDSNLFRTVSGGIPIADRDDVYMVINTTLDSTYLLDDISYTSMFAGTPKGGNQVIIGDLKMRVKEPKGIGFLNYLYEMSSTKLLTSFTGGTFFILKTFFVGHLPDGTTETIHVDPIPMILNHIDSSFDSSGGTYDLTFLPLSGAPTQMLQTNYIGRNLNLSTPKTLGSIITDFQKKLNDQLDEQYAQINKGRKVQYLITIPTEWESFPIEKGEGSENFVETLWKKKEQELKQTTTKASSTKEAESPPQSETGNKSVSTGVNATIMEALKELFNYFPNIYDGATYNREQEDSKIQDDNIILYKINSNITSDEQTFTVHYDITEYFLPKVPANEEEANSLFSQNWFDDAEKTKPKYGMIFDYLYSGNNTEIKNLDIKFHEGLMYLNRNLFSAGNETASIRGQNNGEAGADAKSGVEKGKVNKDVDNIKPIYNIRDNDPVFLSTIPKDSQGQKTLSSENAKRRVKYNEDYANFYSSYNNIQMTIRGNPLLLNQMTGKILPHNTIDYITTIKKREIEAKSAIDYSNDEQKNKTGVTTAMKNGDLYEHFPLFIKVNIYMPAKEGDQFAKPMETFWYNGWYWIQKVEHSYSGGVFEQNLNLLAYTPYGIDSNTDNN